MLEFILMSSLLRKQKEEEKKKKEMGSASGDLCDLILPEAGRTG